MRVSETRAQLQARSRFHGQSSGSPSSGPRSPRVPTERGSPAGKAKRAGAFAGTLYVAVGLYVLAGIGIAELAPEFPCSGDRSLEVTATAYNSLVSQTDFDPNIAAWGDELEPGMRAIAISHDLSRLGLERGTPVCIEGLPGPWRVLDRMHRRWRRRIDIYMGEDLESAREWGRQRVTIRWIDS